MPSVSIFARKTHRLVLNMKGFFEKSNSAKLINVFFGSEKKKKIKIRKNIDLKTRFVKK